MQVRASSNINDSLTQDGTEEKGDSLASSPGGALLIKMEVPEEEHEIVTDDDINEEEEIPELAFENVESERKREISFKSSQKKRTGSKASAGSLKKSGTMMSGQL
jgi:hypothetical protein